MDLMDGSKNWLYLIQTYLWPKEANKKVVVMIWAGIVDQTIIRPFKFDEGVKLNSANYCDFMDKTFFAWYKS